ncbi:MAG: AmmeMemoRadiSam system protein B [Planctomycetota bacterium]|nr:AmmeMemoRadiSam system protein B [Planctomycetota bacterium]
MQGGENSTVRSPAVAGTFYPAETERCTAAAHELMNFGRAQMAGRAFPPLKGKAALGAIVPHAGWICSASIAAEAIAAVAAQAADIDLVVVFGAIHTPLPAEKGVLDSYGAWALPGGTSPIATLLRDELAALPSQFVVDDRFHQLEHAVEVELPLVQVAWPRALVLPIEAPPNMLALEIGQTVAARIAASGLSAIYLASSDLTHYGPNYRFAPAGVGEAGLAWAMENDERLLRIVTDMTPERIVPEVQARYNACGAGAIAAMMSACMAGGASSAVVLRHANSCQTLAAVAPQPPDNAVGYAAVWIG